MLRKNFPGRVNERRENRLRQLTKQNNLTKKEETEKKTLQERIDPMASTRKSKKDRSKRGKRQKNYRMWQRGWFNC